MPPRAGNKKTDTSSASEEKHQLKSKFFSEEQADETTAEGTTSCDKETTMGGRGAVNTSKWTAHWRSVEVPVSVSITPLLARLRLSVQEPLFSEEPKTESGDLLKMSLLESQNIETVRKENFFSEELTEDERDIIAKRVALQQRQFAEYERREKTRKSTKIRAMFDHVMDEEIQEMLADCEDDEDEVIYRLTRPQYLYDIRKVIATKYAREEESTVPIMNADQRAAYEQLLRKRSVTLKKTTNDQAKKQYRMGGRLGLDEALKQAQKHQVDPDKAFEGWSQARIRAYQMIDQNPNSYYYRFNAPGEVQRKGQWTEEEKKLFHARLDEVGANGQWGLFSMKVPGRVGYQCSNYYRLLVETKKINDPNYVLDDRGKAHYLFDKKSANGQVHKTFRTHNKHATASASTAESSTHASRSSYDPGEDPSEGEAAKKASRRSARSTAGQRRRRWGSSASDSDGGERPESSTGYDDDRSGSFTMRTTTGQEDEDGQRRSKRRRRPTEAAVAAGLADSPSYMWNSDALGEEDDGGEKSNGDDEQVPSAPAHPLPGFIDPITLEEVVKPAVSKYGHVMGYDNWVRCLTSWEGKRNICPLTKKPLTKRDLVILDFDNIEEYRHKIVNL